MSSYSYNLPEAYIYFYHTDEYFILPQYPESISDTLQSTFSNQNALSRTAPVFAYVNSGPREVRVSLQLHRDALNNVNTSVSNVSIKQGNDIIYSIGDDYVDILIKKLQTIALPKYDTSNKSIDPPKIAVRFGNDIFIKGVVQGGISLDYALPLLENNKYAQVNISFSISETQPYDAETVGKLGSFRGLTSTFQKHITDLSKRPTNRN